MLPPIFDGPATRGLLDERTGALWAVDSFGALTPGAVHDVADVPPDLYDESFREINSLISPWHQWLDADAYGRHVASQVSRASSCPASQARRAPGRRLVARSHQPGRQLP